MRHCLVLCCSGCMKLFYRDSWAPVKLRMRHSASQGLNTHMQGLLFQQALLIMLAKIKRRILSAPKGNWSCCPGTPFIFPLQVLSVQTDAALSLPLLELTGRLWEGSLSPKTVLCTYLEKVSACPQCDGQIAYVLHDMVCGLVAEKTWSW